MRPPEPAPRGPVRRAASGPPPIILIDTIGELAAVWGLADVAFVGGSLVPGRGRPEHDGAGRLRRLGHVRPAHRPTSARRSSSSWPARRACRVADADDLTLRLLRGPRRPGGRRGPGRGGPGVRPGPARRLGPDPGRARPPGGIRRWPKVGLIPTCVSRYAHSTPCAGGTESAPMPPPCDPRCTVPNGAPF